MMDPDLYARSQALFTAALQVPISEREEFILQSCDGDTDLQHAVTDLLRSDSSAAFDLQLDFEESPIAAVRGLASALAPDQIHDYEVLDVLGVGATGVVLRAQQKGVDREVALKLLHSRGDDDLLARRFAVEAHMLGMLDHPGIVKIFDSGTVKPDGEGQPFLAMELVDGKPITEFARTHQLDAHGCLALVARVADAVQHAHQRGVIHRDLKPANILVTEEGHPRILDFGIARPLDGRGGVTSLDGGTQSVVGTPGYMSPEQMSGDAASMDMRSDVFSLGAIAHELVRMSVRRDRAGANDQAPLHELLEHGHAPLGEIDRRLRGDVEAVVAKALQREKTKRYASAADFAADIRNLLAGEAVTARAPSGFEHWKRVLRRHRVAAGIALGFTVAMLVGVAMQANTIARMEEELRLAEAYHEELIVMLNDPVVRPDGSVIPAEEATVGENFLHIEQFIERFAPPSEVVKGRLYATAASVTGGLGNNDEYDLAALRYSELAVEKLVPARGPLHSNTLSARRNFVRRQLASSEFDEAELEKALSELERDLAIASDDPKLHLHVALLRFTFEAERDRAEEASPAFARAISEAAVHIGDTHRLVLLCEFGYARRLPREAALQRLEELLPIAQEFGRPRLALNISARIARFLLERGKEQGSAEDLENAVAMLAACELEACRLLGASSSTTETLGEERGRAETRLATVLAKRAARRSSEQPGEVDAVSALVGDG